MTKRPSGSGDDCGVPDFMETLAGSIQLCVLATSPGFWSLMQPFLLDSRSWENVKELCVTSKGLQQTEEAKLMEVTAGADTERGSFVGGERITLDKGSQRKVEKQLVVVRVMQ